MNNYEERLMEAHRFWQTLNSGEVVTAQHMFPNCEKYNECCTKDEEFWDNLQERIKEYQPRPTHFRITKLDIKPEKMPEDFRGY